MARRPWRHGFNWRSILSPNCSRMLKKAASFVLASLRGSTYRTEYVSPLRSLRPRWTAFLTILLALVKRLTPHSSLLTCFSNAVR